MTGMIDGLGYEELGQAGSQVGNLFMTGSICTDSFVSGLNLFAAGSVVATKVVASVISGNTLLLAGSIVTPASIFNTAGSPYLQGDIMQFAAETAISGGMWTTVSGAAGGASLRARAAAASTQAPIGVAVASVASGATVNVLARGLCFLTAEGTINNGTSIMMGAGAALNTVAAVGAGSAPRGMALAGAGSEGKALVYLW